MNISIQYERVVQRMKQQANSCSSQLRRRSEHHKLPARRQRAWDATPQHGYHRVSIQLTKPQVIKTSQLGLVLIF